MRNRIAQTQKTKERRLIGLPILKLNNNTTEHSGIFSCFFTPAQSRTLMSHFMVLSNKVHYASLIQAPFTRGKKSIIVHLQRAPTARRQHLHLLSAWAGPSPTMKMTLQDKNNLTQQWCTLQFTKNRGNWPFPTAKQWGQGKCLYCPSQTCKASLMTGMAWMPAGIHITPRIYNFLWALKTVLKHWSLTIDIWTCLSRICAQNSKATLGALRWA